MSDAERTEAAAEQARKVLHELHGAIKDARAVIREAKAIAETSVRDQMDEAVRRRLDELGEVIATATLRSVAKVQSELDRLANALRVE